MGKTKSYADPETMSQQTGYSSGYYQARQRKSTAMPGRHTNIEAEPPSLSVLIKQIFLRLRRMKLSLVYQFHQKTLGIFKQKWALKVGALLVIGYFLFNTERNVSTLFANPIAFLFGESEEDASLGEANLDMTGDVPPSRGKGKSVSWGGNDAAPISVGGLTAELAEDYINRFSKIARAEMDKFGIPASISLAQGLVESRAGTSTLARRNNNHFGMKCFSRRCKKGHCSNFTDDTHKDFFRVYSNAWGSWRAHSEMLASGRYTSLKKHGRDYKKWAYGLKSLGYATDKTYAEKLIGMIERYELDRFDR